MICSAGIEVKSSHLNGFSRAWLGGVCTRSTLWPVMASAPQNERELMLAISKDPIVDIMYNMYMWVYVAENSSGVPPAMPGQLVPALSDPPKTITSKCWFSFFVVSSQGDP